LDNTSLNFEECKLVQPKSNNDRPIDPYSHDYKHMHLDFDNGKFNSPNYVDYKHDNKFCSSSLAKFQKNSKNLTIRTQNSKVEEIASNNEWYNV
jgi:hypothetical protein